MRSLLLTLLFVAAPHFQAHALPIDVDGLYVNSFGDAKNPAVIFVHGGPGYHSYDFEFTVAEKLSEQGFFVVVYDQRGQGRSDNTDIANINYKSYARDLKALIDYFHLNKPALLGHSHGGPISLAFEDAYPGVAGALVLVSAPVRFADSMRSLYENCARAFNARRDGAALAGLAANYRALYMNHAQGEVRIQSVAQIFNAGLTSCRLYTPAHATPLASQLRGYLARNPIQGVQEGNWYGMPAFLENENYIEKDWSAIVEKNADHIYGIYGDEDGLFTPFQLALTESLLPHGHFQLVKRASHAVYLDQRTEFIRVLTGYLRH